MTTQRCVIHEKRRRMLKKIRKTLFTALVTLSLIGQGAASFADACSSLNAANAASADPVTVATLDTAHATHSHMSVTNHPERSASPASATSLFDCCGELLCFMDTCATPAALSIVANTLPQPFDDTSMRNPTYAISGLGSASVSLFRPPILPYTG